MFTTVHGKRIYNCNYTGEAITEFFKIPIPSKLRHKNGKKWTGCYGSVSAAIAQMRILRESEKDWKPFITAEEWDEMCAMLHSSIKRKAGMEEQYPDFVCEPAKHFGLIDTWGGTMTLEQFHEDYKHDLQVKLFEQVIPEDDKVVIPLDEDDTTRAANAPKPWFYTKISRTQPRKEPIPEGQSIEVPRSAGSFVKFLLNLAKTNKTTESSSCVFYFDASDSKKFAISALSETVNWVVNKKASEVMNAKACPVYGDVVIIHKSPTLKEKGKRRNDAESAMAVTSTTDTDTVDMDIEVEVEPKMEASKPTKKPVVKASKVPVKKTAETSTKIKVKAAPKAKAAPKI